MALVQVKQAFRVGLVQRVSRYVSPPQPSSPTSFLWKTDSLSRQRRHVILAQVAECRRMFFTTTISEAGSQPAQGAEPTPEEAAGTTAESDASQFSQTGFSSNAEPDLLNRTYGHEQKDHAKVADASHEHFSNTKDDIEGLDESGYDISKGYFEPRDPSRILPSRNICNSEVAACGWRVSV
ncbi:hypothetical protein R1sor_016480 [Riccia sorocarpa]|uniref:Uncharacterized protein n=1 Tax=Riccia sorocarpa TaxID=122646 RepID=A0ABD3HH48_9MARC